jgi:hypothetical protein
MLLTPPKVKCIVETKHGSKKKFNKIDKQNPPSSYHIHSLKLLHNCLTLASAYVPQNTKNGTDIGWSLGYMINATNALPENHPDRPISSLLFVFLVFIFVGLTVTGAFLAYHAWILVRRRRRYDDYQRLDGSAGPKWSLL